MCAKEHKNITHRKEFAIYRDKDVIGEIGEKAKTLVQSSADRNWLQMSSLQVILLLLCPNHCSEKMFKLQTAINQ